jgi:hypothetical protein
METAGDLLSHINSLINSKYNTYLTAGLHAMRLLFVKIQEMITIQLGGFGGGKVEEGAEAKAAVCIRHLELII